MDITKYAILKKLAGGGGGGGDTGVMVVNFSIGTDGLVADKTVEEVKTAMYTKVVIGILRSEEDSLPLGPCMLRLSDAAIGFAPSQGKDTLMMAIYSSNNTWAAAIG